MGLNEECVATVEKYRFQPATYQPQGDAGKHQLRNGHFV